MKGVFVFISIVFVGIHAFGQSIDIDQTSQFLKPRLRIDGRYFSSFNNDANHLSFTDGQALLTLPINTRVKSNVLDALLDGGNLKELKNDLRLRFSQQMIGARLNYRTISYDTSTSQTIQCLGGSLGITGLQSLKKLNILFYSASVGFSESEQTLSQPRLSFSGIIGNLKLLSIRKYYLYGVFMGYINKRFLPVPFIGAGFPVGKNHSFSLILPAVISYSYYAKKMTATSSFGLEGFRNGIMNTATYTNFSFGGVSFSQSIRFKLKNWLWLRIDGGLALKNSLRFSSPEKTNTYNLPPGYFGAIGLHYNFGSTVFKQLNLIDLL